MKVFKFALALSAFSTLVSCGGNNAADVTPPAIESARAANFTEYDDQGNATNYSVCADNPNQYCARSCNTVSCQSQPNIVTTTIEQRITRIFVVLANPLPNPRTCGQQITYNRAGSCEADNQNVVLGSLHVVSPDAGVFSATWNNNIRETSFGTNQPVAYYRIVAHGRRDYTSSWVSQEIVPDPNSNTVEVTLTGNSIGGATSYAGTQFNGPLDTTGVPLSARVGLIEGQPYWYELVAYNADGSPFLGHLQQPITRPFDFVQTNCGGVLVAGFCSLN